MQSPEKERLDGLRAGGTIRARRKLDEAPATAEFWPQGDRQPPSSRAQRTRTDYSEEAIPERDPEYRPSAGTLHEAETVEHLPAAERLALARRLERLGMSPARAALVASL